MKKVLALALSGMVVALALTAAPAHAGPATDDYKAGTQFGDVLRNKFKQNVDGSGYFWKTFGSGPCTATTSDADYSQSEMESHYHWDNVASYAFDYNSCDTKLYQFANFDTALTGWVNYGGGQSLQGAALNNKTSSYRLS